MSEASKVRSMREAIADSVRDEMSVIIDGFTHLICFAAGHEIIRQKRKNLTAIRLTPDLVYDQMIEAGCVKKMVFSWAGNPGVGSLHALRRRTEPGLLKDNGLTPLELEEYTHFGMVARFLAGSSGLPFWPLRNFNGTDLPGVQPNIKKVTCPFTGEELAAVPPLNPDVAIVHCQRADRLGNAQVWGLITSQKEVAFSAKKVIVVCEELVDTSVIRQDPNRTIIPSVIVSHVVHEPWGCHPSYVQGHYDRDNDFYVQWEDISRSAQTYQTYLQEFVHGCPDRKQYMNKQAKGLMDKLRAKARVCQGVDYGY